MKKLDVTLRAGEPLQAGLVRVADGLIQNGLDRMRCSSSGCAEDVHSVRVTIKRLRAILRLIRPAIPKTVFDREDGRLRKAARRLSLVRDSDVAKRTLASLRFSKGRERDAMAAARKGLNHDGERGAEISKATSQIELDLKQTRRNLHRIQISGDEWNTIEPGLREVYRQCRKRMERALGNGDDEAFHKWRIRVKNLYYGLQMLQQVWPKRLDKMVAGLKQLQEEIGADHDLVVLKRSMHKTPDAFGSAETVERVADSLDHKSKRLRRMTEQLGRQIFDKTPRGFVRELSQHWNKWRNI
jgi:CHAD domain-containing protein